MDFFFVHPLCLGSGLKYRLPSAMHMAIDSPSLTCPIFCGRLSVSNGPIPEGS